MGVLEGIVSSVRRLLGRGQPPEPSGVEDTYRCSICGTDVDGPEATCSLCGGTDIVKEGKVDNDTSGLKGRAAAERSVVDETTTAATLLAETDPLDTHDDRWERIDGGYRVSFPDGDRKVDSQDEVRSLLYREYRNED